MLLPEIRDEIRFEAQIAGENTLDSLIQKNIVRYTREYTGRFHFTELKISDQLAEVSATGFATLQNWSIQKLDYDRIFFLQDFEADPPQRCHLRTWSRYFDRNNGWPFMFRIQQAPSQFTGTIKLTWGGEELVLNAGFTIGDLQSGLETLLVSNRVWCTQLSQTRFQIQTLTLSPDLLLGSNTLGPISAASLHTVTTDKKNLYLDINNPFSPNSIIYQIQISPVDQIDIVSSRVSFDGWLYPSLDERIQGDSRTQFPITRLERAVVCKVASRMSKDTKLKIELGAEAESCFRNCQLENLNAPT